MKKELVLLGFVFLIGFVVAGCSNDLVSYWNFDNNFADMVGGNNGINYGGSFVDGQIGSATNFNGDDYVNVGDGGSLNFGPDDFTYSAWIRTSAVLVNSRIVSQDSDLANHRALIIGVSGNEVDFWCRDASNNAIIAEGSTVINDGEWHYVVGVREGASLNLYIDGNLDGSDTNVLTGNCDGGADTFIGARYVGAGEYFFNGDIDDVSIYNRALTPGEISEIYQKGLDTFGLCECDSSDDVIMKLFSSENSHGALWNDVNYDFDICYDEIFGVAGGGNHVCDGSNKVVGLSDVGNAHADYGNDVCYGGLVCDADITSLGQAPCEDFAAGNSGEDVRMVVALSGSSNAHLSESVDGNYPMAICCYSTGVGGGAVYWANMNGDVISEAGIGHTVMMVLPGASGEYSFEVWESDTVEDDAVRIGEDAITGESVAGLGVVGYWTITEEDLDISDDVFGDEEFYFVVNGISSGLLDFNPGLGDSETVVDIISPGCGEYFDVGTNKEIKINISDSDDLLTGNINVAGEVVPFRNGLTVFDYVFDRVGNFQVVADVVRGDGSKWKEFASVMVIDPDNDGDYAAACIDAPEDFSDIDTSEVRFDASSSLGVRRVDGVTTEVRPGSSGENLKFYWTFSDGRTNPYFDGDNPLSYLFYKRFSVAGNNWAVLNIELI